MMNKLAKEIHENAKSKGFYDKKVEIPQLIALIHSEVSEALEADRKDRFTKCNIFHIAKLESDIAFKIDFENNIKNTFEDELADILIRVLDLSEYLKIDLDVHVMTKMRYNAMRSKLHGKKY